MIRAEGVTCEAGAFRLRGIDLEVGRGEYFVLLGPPGSGKTIFLECLCGLRRLRSGRIRVGAEDVTLLEPRRRGLGYVPQDYALFPHRTVERNIAFGPEVAGLAPGEVRRRTIETAERLGIRDLLPRRIAGLSGGEKQRVALARALAVSPRVLLLDEPLSALDETTREDVSLELQRLQRETGTTTVHVCHNFEEARILSDRLGVMLGGALAQAGTADELFRRPRSAELARFLRTGSILEGTAEPQGAGSLVHAGPVRLRSEDPASGAVSFVVLADEIRLRTGPAEPGENVLEGRLILLSPRGPFGRADVEIAPGLRLTARLPRMDSWPAPGSCVEIRFPPSAVRVLPPRGS